MKDLLKKKQSHQNSSIKLWLALAILAAALLAITDYRPLAPYMVVPAIPIFFLIAWLKDDKADSANETDMSFLLISVITGVLGLLYLIGLTIDLLSHENTVIRSVARGVSVSPLVLLCLLWRLSRKSKKP